jgi:hypothetical protein
MGKKSKLGMGTLAVIGLAVWALWPKKSSGVDQANAALQLQIIPAGMSQMRRSRMSGIMGDLIEGSAGNIARLTIKNTSTKGGQLVAYTFGLTGTIMVGSTVISPFNAQIMVPAGGSTIADFNFTIPIGRTGTGSASVILMDTDRANSLTNASTTFVVAAAAVIPGGTVTW